MAGVSLPYLISVRISVRTVVHKAHLSLNISYEALYNHFLVPPNRPTASFSFFITTSIGAATIAVLWFPLPLLHWTGVEPFELPSMHQTGCVALIAIAGLAFNASFMLLLAFSSPVIAAVGLMLTYDMAPCMILFCSALLTQSRGVNDRIPLISMLDLFLGTAPSLDAGVVVGGLLVCVGFSVLASTYASRKVASLTPQDEHVHVAFATQGSDGCSEGEDTGEQPSHLYI